MTVQEFYALLLADVAKAPLILADVATLKADAEKTLTDAGLPIPWASVTASASTDATTLQLESQLKARKIGGGILAGIGAFLQSPIGQQLLQLLLGSLIPKPAA